MKKQNASKYDKSKAFTLNISQTPATTPMGEYLMKYLIVFLSVLASLSTVEYVLQSGVGTYYRALITIPLFVFTVLFNLAFGGISVYIFNKCRRSVRLIYGLSPLVLIVLCIYWVAQTTQVLSECIAASTYKWFSVNLPVLGIFSRISFSDLRTALLITFIVSTFALSVLFSVLVIRLRRMWLFVLALLPFFWLAANYDVQPNDFIIDTILLALLAMIPFSATRIRKRRKLQSNSGMRPAGASLAFFSAGLASVIVLSAVLPRDQYIYHDFFANGFSNPLEGIFQMFTQSNSGMSGGKLGDIEELTRNGKIHLEVSGLRSSDTVYLKGYTGSIYTGRTFDLLPEQNYTQNLSGYSKSFRDVKNTLWREYERTPLDIFSPFWETELPALMGGNEDTIRRTIMVKRVGADTRYTYVPYYAYAFAGEKAFLDGQVYYDTGLVPDRKNEWTYSMYAYPDDRFGNVIREIDAKDERHLMQLRLDLRNSMPEEYLSYATFYKSFADQMYTKLPEDGRFDWMKELFWENISLSDAVHIVKSTVQDGTTYSLRPGKTPSDQDFVNYFLKTNKKGFCMHYAASAVMLFRAAGIPARYAEGYVVTETDVKNAKNGVAAVKDQNAHAWAEIYVEPLGWVPVEVTPGFSAASIAPRPVEEEKEQSSSSQSESSASSNSEPSSEPESSASEPESSILESSAAEESSQAESSIFSLVPDESSGTISPDDAKTYDFTAWIVAGLSTLAVIVLFGAVLLARGANICRRRKRIHSSDRSRAACAIYAECLHLMRLIGLSKEMFEDSDRFAAHVDATIFIGMSFKEVTRIAERARFSDVPISEEERSQLLVFLKMLQKYVKAHLPFYKKLSYFRRYPLR